MLLQEAASSSSSLLSPTQEPGDCTALPIGPLQSWCEQLQLLLQALPAASLSRFGVFDFTLKSTCLAVVQTGRTCLLFVLGQAEHRAGHLPQFLFELRCRAVSWGTLGPSQIGNGG